MLPTPSHDLATEFNCQTRAGYFAGLVGCLACILVVAGLSSAFLLPQAPGRMAEPSADLISALPLWSFIVSLPLPIPRQSDLLAITLFLTSALTFAAYASAVYLFWNRPSERWSLTVVVGAALLSFLIAACALPNVNRDIYNYIISGRVAAVYGGNPHELAPDRFPNDPLYRYASERYTSYPGDNKLPVWTLLNVALAGLGGDNPVANLLIYRGAFLLFNIANLALIGRILQFIQPRRLLAGLALYGWNPIVITYGQSKVDTVMVFFLLLAVLALVRHRRKAALVALGISALVKLITLPLIAVYWLYLLRSRGKRELASGTLLLGLTAVLFYAPFWYGPELIAMQLESLRNVTSAGPSLAQLLIYAGFGLAAVWIGLSRDGRLENMLAGWALLMLLFALFLTKFGYSWYLMTVIAVSSLVLDRRFVPIVIILSFVSFLLNAWDSASNEVMQMPILFPAPRFYMQLLFVCLSLLVLAGLEIGRKVRQRHSAEYGIERH